MKGVRIRIHAWYIGKVGSAFRRKRGGINVKNETVDRLDYTACCDSYGVMLSCILYDTSTITVERCTAYSSSSPAGGTDQVGILVQQERAVC